MKVTLDSAGRLLVPNKLRRAAGFKPGMELHIRLRNGVIEIEPALQPITLKKRGRLRVGIPGKPIEALRAEMVEQMRRRCGRRSSI